MELEVIWSDFAESQLDEIYKYYEKNVSTRIAKDMIRNLINEPKRLIKNPFIGQEENLLKQRKISYRYLVYKSYKIIYSVDEKNKLIKIADVFNTLQYPEKMKRTK